MEPVCASYFAGTELGCDSSGRMETGFPAARSPPNRRVTDSVETLPLPSTPKRSDKCATGTTCALIDKDADQLLWSVKQLSGRLIHRLHRRHVYKQVQRSIRIWWHHLVWGELSGVQGVWAQDHPQKWFSSSLKI